MDKGIRDEARDFAAAIKAEGQFLQALYTRGALEAFTRRERMVVDHADAVSDHVRRMLSASVKASYVDPRWAIAATAFLAYRAGRRAEQQRQKEVAANG